MLQGSKVRIPAWGFNPEKKPAELPGAWNQFIKRAKSKHPSNLYKPPNHWIEASITRSILLQFIPLLIIHRKILIGKYSRITNRSSSLPGSSSGRSLNLSVPLVISHPFAINGAMS